MARASASRKPGEIPSRIAARLTAVSMRPCSPLPTSAKGRSSGSLPPLSRFSLSIGKSGIQMDTIRIVTKLHDPASCRRHPPAAFQREPPDGCAGCGCVERRSPAPCRFDPPPCQRPGEARPAMPGKKQAGRAARLRGKGKAPGDEWGLHLKLAERSNEGARFKTLFERPGGLHRQIG